MLRAVLLLSNVSSLLAEGQLFNPPSLCSVNVCMLMHMYKFAAVGRAGRDSHNALAA
jgi:hypothetical protein